MANPVLWRSSISNVLMRYGVVAIVAALSALVLVANPTARPDKQLHGANWVFFFLILSATIAAVITFSGITAEVRRDAFVLRYGPWGWPVQRIDWQTVAKVQVITVRPTEWGGWGYRWVPWRNATAAVMRKGPGLRFDFGSGRVFVVTLDDAENALAAIRRVLDELPPAALN